MNEFDNLRLYQAEYFLGVCMVLADVLFFHTPGLTMGLSGGIIALFSVIVGISYYVVAINPYISYHHEAEKEEEIVWSTIKNGDFYREAKSKKERAADE